MNAGAAHGALHALPMAGFETIVGSAPLLVLAPHPDDESLGCGGLIAEAAARGHPVHVAVLTDGSRSHTASRTWPAARLAALRAGEVRGAVARLGLPQDRLALLGLPDGDAPHDGPAFEGALDRLIGLMGTHSIGTVAASWRHDPHGDHGAAAKLAAAACAKRGARHLAYPIWAWELPEDAWVDGPIRGWRLDVTAHLAAKRRAIAAHASQAGMITDDPTGFVLADAFVRRFLTGSETFLDETGG